jgi:transcriptional regulator with XRE-family HTH domain
MTAQEVARMATNKDFGMRLQRLMKERDVTLREAAEAAGIPTSTLHRWRQGSPGGDYAALKKLAVHLGVTLDYLLTGESDEPAHGLVAAAVGESLEQGGVLFDGLLEVRIRRVMRRGGG